MTNQAFSECMQKMQAGDMEGLKLIYEAYLPMIYHCMLDVVHRKEPAEDLTSDFFVKLFQLRDTFSGDAHRKWMLTIARNMAIDYVRKYDREYLVDPGERQDYIISHGETQGREKPAVRGRSDTAAVQTAEYTQVENRLSIAAAMKILKPEEAEIVHLKLMAELTLREIADLLKQPQGTVAWKYREALKKLRKVLKDA